MRGLEKLIASMLAPVSRRVRMLATRVTITAVDDSRRIQTVQVSGLEGEDLPDVQRLQQFGFSANPPIGATGLVICIGGSRTNPVVISAEDGSTRVLNLEPGEACVYNAFGDFIRLKTSGEVLVKARSKVTADAPLVHALHDMQVGGNLLVEGHTTIAQNLLVEGAAGVTGALASATSVSDPTGSMAGMRGVFNGHTQPVSGGVAQPPSTPM